MEKNLANETVLFVDDEANILNALRRELMDEEYRCLFASSGNQALKVMQKEDVSVIVCDMKMPDMDGLRLLKLAKERYPAMVRIVLSGYTQLPQILLTINQTKVFKYLTKPWGDELKSVVREAIDYHRLQADRVKIEQLLSLQCDESCSIMEKIGSVILAAKNSGTLFAAMGIKAFKVAADMLDRPMEQRTAKQQLLMASSLLSELAGTDFEEYRDMRVGIFCENLSKMLKAESPVHVEIEKTPAFIEMIKTRRGIFSRFVVSAIRALTASSENAVVKIKPAVTGTDRGRRMELACMIMAGPESGSFSAAESEAQQIYVDMLNMFVKEALALLNGDFQGIIVNGIVILRIVVSDCSEKG